MSPRIAFGGFLHETNTFAPSKAGMDAFLQGGGWPSLSRGADIFAGVHDPSALPWRRLRPGVRTAPLGPVFG